jgi:hypothetical protein
MYPRNFSIRLCLPLSVLLLTQSITALAQSIPEIDYTVASQVVKLYYFREAPKIVAVLHAVKKQDSSGDLKDLIISSVQPDEVILYGPARQRNYARRLIVAMDLPRPGVQLEMWGIQISSRKAKRMADVMPDIRREINRTQTAVRSTYARMQDLARDLIPRSALDPEFNSILTSTLLYRSALDTDRPLSLPDILLRMIAANDPGDASKRVARELNSWLNDNYPENVAFTAAHGKRPFERFFETRGLKFVEGAWTEPNRSARRHAMEGRVALLQFALNYGQLVHEPRKFSPYALQQSAESLNSRLQDATDALNLDLQELFMDPAIERIRRIVDQYDDVEYAQVGKTSVASLSGVPTEVSSQSVSTFDVTPPLKLSELLERADHLSKNTGAVVPSAEDTLVGSVPLTQVIGLIAAFGEERSVWRELQSGISLKITPTVLRNMTSAELAVDLRTGDPEAGDREKGVRPLSRVSQHDVKTSVYVHALDFFDLSAFASQSTLDGGRGYAPLIGPIWQGVFGAVPGFGGLFSWKREDQTVYHESLVLTISYVTPTVMGVAALYPTELVEPITGEAIPFNFWNQARQVEDYKARLQTN